MNEFDSVYVNIDSEKFGFNVSVVEMTLTGVKTIDEWKKERLCIFYFY